MYLIILLILACSATVHWVVGCVLSLYSRYQISYLCLAWVNIIFAAALTGWSFFPNYILSGEPGILHPIMLLVLVCLCYLQSIYPLSIPMPGFLQWGRMIKYASPAILLIFLYLFALSVGGQLVYMHSFDDFIVHLLSGDILLRLSALALSIYYIINIFRLPRVMAKSAEVPPYLIGYCTVLGLLTVFYVVVTIFYNVQLLMLYVILFTILNLYLFFRVLENMAIVLPHPVLEEVSEEPTEEEVNNAEHEDFNEANHQRFQRIQYWMQNNPTVWTDNTFGRDRLCESVGYNRHLVLQSVRSQGFNNVHDYINSYRVEYLKRLVAKGEITSVTECVDAGFGTTKTARSCFLKLSGESLDAFLARSVSTRLVAESELPSEAE